MPPTLPLRFAPSLVVNGLGLRVGKASGPLLDAGRFQALHPAQAGRLRQPGAFGEFGIADAAVALQLVQQCSIDTIKVYPDA